MKIVKSNGGQLCNRIWSYTFLIAHSLKFEEKMFIIDFDEYIHLFDNLSILPNVYFIKNIFIKKLINLLLRFLRIIRQVKNFDINKKNKGINAIFGWEYRNERLYLEEYQNSIRNLFNPTPDVMKKINALVREVKHRKFLVGVHIRRGDYKNFFNGVYYFENSVYKNYMDMMSFMLSNKQVCFLICSAEKIDVNDFPRLDCFQIPVSSSIEDLYCLSLCDYIIGPPSTFSMWASFYGKVPLRIIKKKIDNINLKQFNTIVALDTFKDGSTFRHDVNQIVI